MSDNPYAPPRADLGMEAPGLGVAGRGDFEIGQCISDAWAHTWSDFGLWLGVGVVWTLAAVVSAMTGIGLLLAVPVLFWGIVYFFLRMHDGTAAFGDAFAEFSRYGRALGTMLALFLLLFLISLVGQSVQITGDVTGTTWLTLVGALVNLAFAFRVTARLNFS